MRTRRLSRSAARSSSARSNSRSTTRTTTRRSGSIPTGFYSRSSATTGGLRIIQARYFCAMGPLRYSINVTLDGCVDHRAFSPGEDVHRHAAENIAQADALLLGRVTYEL